MNSVMFHLNGESSEDVKFMVRYLKQCEVNVLDLTGNGLEVSVFTTIDQLKELEKVIHNYIRKEGKKHA